MTPTRSSAASGIAFLSLVAVAAVGASHSRQANTSFAFERSGLAPQEQAEERMMIADGAMCSGEIAGLPISTCFAPGTSVETQQAVLQAMIDAWYAENGAEGGAAFVLGNRWSLGGSSSQGTPVSIRWSVVPDGIFIPSTGLGSGNNNVNAKMVSTFGSVEAGKNLFRQVFQRWADLTGISYVELEDDGAAWGSSGSSARGDVRIAAHGFNTTDVLAYNFFPGSGTGGDMVINSGISWGPATNNWRSFRNILAHEHGHGIGIEHVCPLTSTKLMEPFLATNFDGPQHDDIRAAQRHYGDSYEPNDGPSTATMLPSPTGQSFLNNLAIDDNGDADWFKFDGTVNMTVTIKAQPTGSTYLSGPQTQQCNTGSSVNSTAIQDLRIDLYRANGTVLIASQNTFVAGISETLSNFVLTTNEAHHFKISAVGSVDNIQTYTLTATLIPGVAPIPGDLNNDGFVNGADLGILLSQWGGSGVGDINNSGTVDGADLGLLLSAWQ